MAVVRASTKVQIVIPADIRRRLGVQRGTYFHIEESEGVITLQPLGDDPIEAGYGMLADGGPLTPWLLKEHRAEAQQDKVALSSVRHERHKQ